MIPRERMNARREHRVAISPAARSVLAAMRATSRSDFVFAGHRPGEALSNMTFLRLLRRIGRSDITAHGFRSSFRDWAAEQTTYPGEVVEMALARVIGNKVEAGYRRGDMFKKRLLLMRDRARHCTGSAPAAAPKSASEPVAA